MVRTFYGNNKRAGIELTNYEEIVNSLKLPVLQ